MYLVDACGRSLVAELIEAGHAVWLLDWRGGWRVVEAQSTRLPSHLFRLESAAQFDIAAALDAIEAAHPGQKIALIAHCLGAGMLSYAIAMGQLLERPIQSIVLIALGLFYRVPVEGLIKAQDRLLERIRLSIGHTWLSPRDDRMWASDMLKRSFELYRQSLISSDKNGSIYTRLAFMFGAPYDYNGVPEAVNQDSFLAKQFGAMHLEPYIQGTQNIRRGWAGRFGASPQDRELLAHPERFRMYPTVLLTGARNALWHRDAIDRMEAFLRRADGPKAASLYKKVLPEFAHQDLIWGQFAPQKVFPLLREAASL